MLVTTQWPLKLQLTSPHLPGFVFYGGLKALWRYLRYVSGQIDANPRQTRGNNQAQLNRLSKIQLYPNLIAKRGFPFWEFQRYKCYCYILLKYINWSDKNNWLFFVNGVFPSHNMPNRLLEWLCLRSKWVFPSQGQFNTLKAIFHHATPIRPRAVHVVRQRSLWLPSHGNYWCGKCVCSSVNHRLTIDVPMPFTVFPGRLLRRQYVLSFRNISFLGGTYDTISIKDFKGPCLDEASYWLW